VKILDHQYDHDSGSVVTEGVLIFQDGEMLLTFHQESVRPFSSNNTTTTICLTLDETEELANKMLAEVKAARG
jgi:hypothetical protein